MNIQGKIHNTLLQRERKKEKEEKDGSNPLQRNLSRN